MEASALNHVGTEGLRGPTPLLRIQSDERLVALTRRGNQAAYEALVARYQSRLLAFCRHMLGSREDAEDVLQEVFAAAFNAMLADDRSLNVRPWLYRIARNRSLNHLRRTQAIGVDSMDVHLSEHGTTTADKVHKREEFRQLMEDVQELPETQRTALLLREIDALSYEQIAEAMETTVPSIKSLLVRARVSLAEAAEARLLSCEEVREELGEVAEGLRRTTAPARRHLRGCERCSAFRKQLRDTNKALASVLPVGPLLLLKKLLLAHLGTTAGAGGAAAGAAGASAAGVGAGGAVSASMSAVASKAAAGLAAAAIVTAGAVEVDHVRHPRDVTPAAAAAPSAPVEEPAPVVVSSQAQPAATTAPATSAPAAKTTDDERARDKKRDDAKADRDAAKAAVGGSRSRQPRAPRPRSRPPRRAPGACAAPPETTTAARPASTTPTPTTPATSTPPPATTTPATPPTSTTPAPSAPPAATTPPPTTTPATTAPATGGAVPQDPASTPPGTSTGGVAAPAGAGDVVQAPQRIPPRARPRLSRSPRLGMNEWRAQPTRSPTAAAGSGLRSSTPSSLYVPRTSTSERTGPIWRGGKFTTPSTSRPSSCSRA